MKQRHMTEERERGVTVSHEEVGDYSVLCACEEQSGDSVVFNKTGNRKFYYRGTHQITASIMYCTRV